MRWSDFVRWRMYILQIESIESLKAEELKMCGDQPPDIYTLAGGEINVWVDPGGAICFKTRNPFNDPVELSEYEAIELAELLTKLVAEQ